MRILKAHSQKLFLVVCVAALASPRLGRAQSNGDQFQSSWYCEYVNSYAQFCDFIIGVSSLTIDATGSITTSATTDPVWGFYINTSQCENEGNGACTPPFQPEVSATVQTTISPSGTSGSGATSGSASGGAEVQLELPASGTTLQADQTESTYTESSQHWASFDPPGSEQSGLTSTDVVFDGPWFVTATGERAGPCDACATTIQTVIQYQVMNYSGSTAGTIQACEAPVLYNYTCHGSFTSEYNQCSNNPTGGNSGPTTAYSGQITDTWTLGSDKITPAGCGADITDPWKWFVSAQITPTLATLSGYIDTNAISINGVVYPPNRLTGYTVCPSGTTVPPGWTVTPCD